MAGVAVALRDGRAHFSVRLAPRAGRSAIAGARDGVLAVRVAAAPIGGAANAALIELLADALDVAPSAIRLEAGVTARLKRLSVPGAAAGSLRRL